MHGKKRRKADRSIRSPRLFKTLIMILTTWVIMLACADQCFALDIKPPPDKEIEDFIENWESMGTLDSNSGQRFPNHVVKTEKIHSVVSYIDDVTGKERFVVYYLLIFGYTTEWTEEIEGEIVYHTKAVVDARYWSGEIYNGDTLQPTSGYGEVMYDVPKYRNLSPGEDEDEVIDRLVNDCANSIMEEEGYQPGWPTVNYSGKAVPLEEGGGGSKIPGPGSWWTWLTGTVIAGIIAAIAGLLNSLLGLSPVTVTPSAPPVKPIPPGRKPSAPSSKSPPPKKLPSDVRKRRGPRPPLDLKVYPGQPEGVLDSIKEFLSITKDAAGMTISDAGTAIKDAVPGLIKGTIAVPATILQGYVELGRLAQTLHSDYVSGRSSIFSDLFGSREGWQSLKEVFGDLFGEVGHELLPMDEIGSFFNNNSSLEEKLWAIPSAVTKLTNLLLLSERLSSMRVPGLPADLTAINSFKASTRAIEAAKAAAAPGVQTEYDAYLAAANRRASELAKTVEGGGKLAREQVLEAMSDPATMRRIKGASEALQKEFNAVQAKEIYEPVYKDVVDYMKSRDPKGIYKVGGVRTPGQTSLINTDNDVIVQRYVKTREGYGYWQEVPAHEWENAFFDSFAKRTGFDPAVAKTRFPEKKWEAMTPQEQRRTWTEMHGQEAMDVKNPEAAQSFSNQPSVMRPKWRPESRSPVAEGTIVDGEGLYRMEAYKTTRGWKGEGVTLKTKSEAMEQGAKLCKLSRKMALDSYKRTGNYSRYPEIFAQGERIINMRNISPEIRDAALRQIGFKGGYEDFMEKLSSWTGRLP